MGDMQVAKRSTDLVKKNAAAIHIKNDISCLQRKVWNVLLSNAYDSLGEASVLVHDIPLRDLMDQVNFDSKNSRYIKEALENLAVTPLTWDIINDAGKTEWGVSTALASAIIVDGVCSYAYSPHLRPKLYNPAIFAKIDIRIVSRFSSGHALALYENCVRYRGVRQTPYLALELFRDLLGVGDNTSYDDFKVLNRAVIKPALAEISTVSDICVEVELKREKRKVVALKFHIKENPQGTLNVESDSAFDIELLSRLQEYFGLTERQAKDVLVTTSVERVRATMAYVEKKFAEGKIKSSIAPYFLKVVKEGDIYVGETGLERDKRLKQERLREAAAHAQDAALAKQSFADLRLAEVHDYLGALPESARSVLEAKFAEFIAEKNATVYTMYRKNGFKSKMVQVEFTTYVDKYVLPSADGKRNELIRARNDGK